MTLAFGNYTFCCTFTNPAELPEFKGSTFRGVFGIALKHVVCALRQNTCQACLLSTRCLYAQVFEPPSPEKVKDRSRDGAVPHPFVIEPPETVKTRFEKGDHFQFNLLLFGDTNHHLPYFVYAFKRIGETGMGKKINGSGGTFTLDSLAYKNILLYSASDSKLPLPESIESLAVPTDITPDDNPMTVTVTMKTPFRLKYKHHLKADLPFKALVTAMLRRMSSLMEQYGGGEPPLDYRSMVYRANQVKIKESSLAWVDFRRYSNRQEQSMLMGGIMGSVTYHGPMNEYIPLFRFCEKVHVGKQTSFGLGQISITVHPPG